ncbi:MAG: Eco57I restriction-modification methylase domain-containing protein [Pseudomonadales bacterium]|nr:Eco57I restriction-modification methylase domain-containing protein [Pseudomonadales bacterium]
MPPSNNNTQNEMKENLKSALQAFQSGSLIDASITLLNTLGYSSDKTIRIPGSEPKAFLNLLAENNPDVEINREKALFDDWLKVDILFQLTDEELSHEASLFKDNSVNASLLQSYLFFAIELRQKDYSRGKLTSIARQLNRVFPMPVMVFIKHGDLLSIAVINRRVNKRDAEKDVLGKVTIIRDISLSNPHRGHLDIIHSFALPSLLEKTAIYNFDTLHAAWEEIFNVELLNKRFYKELANWYFWALPEVSFPDDMKPVGLTKEQEADYYEKLRATGLIRLLTRIIFCWFLKEKHLIPERLFDVNEIQQLLKSLDPNESTYHQAILQNLFFATLNQRMGKDSNGELYRTFARDEGFLKNRNTYGVDNLYRYESLFNDPEVALTEFEDIPFLNGGLFECLDRTDENGKKIYVDGFSRNKKKRPNIPNRFFFGEGKVDIGAVTGEKRRGTEKVRGLIQILSAYKFTIFENTPIDQEIALDPELLGKVFENLLASYNEETKTTARKQTGSFYTPRPIVDYMVDESLKAHLATVLAREHGMAEEDARVGLDSLFAYTEKEHPFTGAEVDTLIKAIDTCKILDPACGSGAFPMGVLHKLVYILTKLDPNNTRWKQTQLDKLDSVSMREELERTFENNNDDYGRKLYLIENCLYGVDIQPIAIQLSKLRFFISLICDQKTNKNKAQNHGVRPLPNLETKFVAADTLISLDKATHVGLVEFAQNDLFDNTEIERIEKELQKIRHEYFAVQTRRKKLDLQKKDKQLRQQLAKELMRSTGADQVTSHNLAQWDPYDTRHAAEFFEPVWMFDRTIADGFDLVIGNPPYIQIQKFPKDQKDIWVRQQYLTYAATADVYCLFYERGAQLLREGGRLCYITSNKWMRAGYGEKLREFLSNNVDTTTVLDFGMAQNFGAATTYTCVLTFVKQAPKGKTRSCYASDDQAAMADPESYLKANSVVQQDLDAKPWVVLPKERQRIKTLVEEQGVPLEEWDIQINYGIKTGFNDAFYITSEQREAMIAEEPACEEIIVPLLRGRFVERFGTNWDGTWMIATFPTLGYEITKLPKPIVNHLLGFRERIEPKPSGWSGGKWNGRKAGSYRWFETQDSISYYQEFSKPKIIYPNMTKYLSFYFDRNDHYFGNQKCFIISGGTDLLPYLTAVLNSALFRCCFKDNFPELLGNTYELSKIFFETIPIKRPAEEQIDLFDQLVALVQFAKKQTDPAMGGQSEFIENLIDACVMECYFHDHMKDKDLLFHADTFRLVGKYDLESSESEQSEFLNDFYKTANSPDHPIRNRLLRLTADSPDLLALIKEHGAV